MKKKGRAGSIDEYIGVRLRQRRTLLGITQEKLAESVGITFQQIQKYENGANRVSAGRLFEFSKILKTSMDYFYENYKPSKSKSYYKLGLSDGEQEPIIRDQEDVMARKETLELVRAYYSIKDEELRKNLLSIAKTMAKSSKSDD